MKAVDRNDQLVAGLNLVILSCATRSALLSCHAVA